MNGELPRFEIPDLDLELALVEGWLRFWFRGKLVPLPVNLAHEVTRLSGDLGETKRKLRTANERARFVEAEIARLKDELERREISP